MTRSVLVTGANGFVGTAVMARLAQMPDITPVAAVRHPERWVGPGRAVGYDLLADAFPHLSNVDTVIHCAARVHIMKDKAENPLEAYQPANTDGAARLAAKAAASGVRRFIFISTIKVNGENTLGRGPFRSDDLVGAQDPYAISKLTAERRLLEIGERTGLEILIIRPPLVYGPGVRANFRSMIAWLDRGWPLPFGALHNRRSMIAVQNLADLVVHCIAVPVVGIFLARDSETPTTTELMVQLAQALQKPPRLLSVPPNWLRYVGKATGTSAVIRRLTDPLEVDLADTTARLGWNPPLSMDQALRLTVAAYRTEHR